MQRQYGVHQPLHRAPPRASEAAVGLAMLSFVLLTAGPVSAQAPKTEGVPDPLAQLDSSDGVPQPLSESMLRPRQGGPHIVKPVEKEIAFSAGTRKSVRAWLYVCQTHAEEGCVLGDPMAPGQPLRATHVSWSVSNIYWQPGLRWPILTAVCPDSHVDWRMKFRNAKSFSVVPAFGGYYFRDCGSSGSRTGTIKTDVIFYVNDFPGAYGDNAGTYEVTIWDYW